LEGLDVRNGTEPIKLLIIAGPTASGKTGLAVRLAEMLDAEIISADSMQVYRGMDIGTAKPSAEERRRVRHHLLDLVAPDQPFSAADFRREAAGAVADITGRGKRVIVTGGTGLYIKALTRGLMESPAADEVFRKELKELAAREGKVALLHRLSMVDPETAASLHPNDQVRIIRALEVHRTTGRPISALRGEHRFAGEPYRTVKIGLKVDRGTLYRAIDNRVEQMIAGGLLDEVRSLLEAGYSPELKPMLSIGYRHVVEYLVGSCSLEEAVSHMKRDTRRYAKRQMTWFNRDEEINWIEYPGNVAMIERTANDFFD